MKPFAFSALICLLFVGCGSSITNLSSEEDVGSNLKVYKLLQESQREVTLADLMQSEIGKFGPNPERPKGVTHLGLYADTALKSNPTLSYRKFSNTILNSKTGTKTEFATTFTSLAYSLDGFLRSKYFFAYAHYLSKVIDQEALKAGYPSDYFKKIKQNMKNPTYFGRMAPSAGIGSSYMASLSEVIFLASSIYHLTDKSPKIGFIAYNLQQNNYYEVEKIVRREIQNEVEKVMRKKITKDYNVLSGADKNILSTFSPTFFDEYAKYLDKNLVNVRKLELENYVHDALETMSQNGIENAYDFYSNFSQNTEKMNSLNAALFHASRTSAIMLNHTSSPSSCFIAGMNILLNASSGNSNDKLKVAVIDSNILYLKNNNCPEADAMREVGERYRKQVAGPAFIDVIKNQFEKNRNTPWEN